MNTKNYRRVYLAITSKFALLIGAYMSHLDSVKCMPQMKSRSLRRGYHHVSDFFGTSHIYDHGFVACCFLVVLWWVPRRSMRYLWSSWVVAFTQQEWRNPKCYQWIRPILTDNTRTQQSTYVTFIKYGFGCVIDLQVITVPSKWCRMHGDQ